MARPVASQDLLQYATHHAASDDGPPVRVRALAPLLTAMLDALFQAGRVPAGVTSALVTPAWAMVLTLALATVDPLRLVSRYTDCNMQEDSRGLVSPFRDIGVYTE